MPIESANFFGLLVGRGGGGWAGLVLGGEGLYYGGKAMQRVTM